MKKLSRREEEIMHIFWKLERAFIKEVLHEFKNSKLHYNTIATLIKILEEKGFLGHEAMGNTFRYFPLISREEYKDHAMKDFVKNYFDDSYSSMLLYFARDEKLSTEELNEIIKKIKSKRK